MNTRELIAAVKAAQGITSDYRLARFLGVTDQTVGNWQHGRRRPDDETAIRLAGLAGLDPDAVLVALYEERATDEASRAAWARIASRLARAGVAGVVAVLAVTGSPDAPAFASETDSNPAKVPGASLHIMLNAVRRAFMHWIARRRSGRPGRIITIEYSACAAA